MQVSQLTADMRILCSYIIDQSIRIRDGLFYKCLRSLQTFSHSLGRGFRAEQQIDQTSKEREEENRNDPCQLEGRFAVLLGNIKDHRQAEQLEKQVGVLKECAESKNEKDDPSNLNQQGKHNENNTTENRIQKFQGQSPFVNLTKEYTRGSRVLQKSMI